MLRVAEVRERIIQRYAVLSLALLELVLGLAFFIVSRVSGSMYFRGVAVGLLISGVTSAIAYVAQLRATKKGVPGGH